MKKNLFTIGLLALGLTSQAQNVLLHVDDTATMYVSKGTLVYNGGGLQTKGTGIIDLHGNMMVVGGNNDVLKTINTTGTDRSIGNNVVLRMNEPSTPLSSTYGQLYITGIPQNVITGVVSKEYASTKHGAYQQMAIPFIGKALSSLNTEGGGNFNSTRWGGREILKWDNANVRFDGNIIPSAPITSANVPGIAYDLNYVTTAADRTAYFTLGSSTFNPETIHTFSGVPYADGITGVNVKIMTPSTVNYGTGGNNRNIYQEKYNTYIWDNFDMSTPWVSNFGKNVYQYSNPYFTNLDLSLIGFAEGGGTTDNNNITNIQGIYVDPNNVVYTNTAGTSSSYASGQMVTFDANGKPVGTIAALSIKPLGTFKIKLRTNASATLDFDNLRRFNSTLRADGTGYAVTANKNNPSAAIKQLGILALDAAGNQIGETYYAVANHFTTGNIPDPTAVSSVQAMTATNAIIQTFEESVNGGTDANFASSYRLYINEANEVNFLGKRIDLSVFGANVSSLKFEIRDNTQLIQNGSHLLSSGVGFYYAKPNGQIAEARQGDVIPVSGSNYGVYYGSPQNVTLGTTDLAKNSSRTLVTYHPSIKNYIVRFDPDWKSASIEVYDASGKLVISEKSIKTISDYVIKLDNSLNAMYMVKVQGNDGTVVNSKIVIK